MYFECGNLERKRMEKKEKERNEKGKEKMKGKREKERLGILAAKRGKKRGCSQGRTRKSRHRPPPRVARAAVIAADVGSITESPPTPFLNRFQF